MTRWELLFLSALIYAWAAVMATLAHRAIRLDAQIKALADRTSAQETNCD